MAERIVVVFMVKAVVQKIKKQKIVKKGTIKKSGMFVMASIGPIMTVPQALQIWVFKQTSGIFVPTWEAYFLVSVGWLVYAISRKDKPLFFNALANTILNLIIVTGVLVVHP